MSFQIRKPLKIKLAPIMLRLRPVTIGQLRKLAFESGVSMQELANQMIEYCLEELDGKNDDHAG